MVRIKFPFARVVIILLLMLVSCHGITPRVKYSTFFVSADRGSDNNPGTNDEPFQSIQHAVNLLKAGDTCYILEGVYREEVVTKGLAGSEESPIVIAAAHGHKVVLDGTMDISGDWQLHNQSIYKTVLDQDIWQLFVDGKMMTSARWPNAEAWTEDMWDLEGTWMHQADGSSYGHFIDDGTLDLAGTGIDFTGAMAVMNVGSWETFAGRVMEHGAGNAGFYYEKTFPESNFRKVWEGRAFFECAMACLDAPGEWFYEKETGSLYLCTEDGRNPSGKEIKGKIITYALQIDSSRYLEIRGLDFFGCTGSFAGCDHLLIRDCDFMYPSYSRRMLGSTDKPEATTLYTTPGILTENRIINCTFMYADGSGIRIGGVNDLIANCEFYSIDYGCVGTVNDVFINARDATRLTFRRNTMVKGGNSVGLKTGAASLVELNFATRLGMLQHDGSALQASTENVEGTVMRKNWVFQSAKSGIRFDSPWNDPDVYGMHGTINYNVIWNTRRIQPKGDHHRVYHNTSFDNEQADLSIFAVVEHGGVNEHTITRNNAVNVLSGSNFGPPIPISGIHDHNWVGMEQNRDVKDELRDPGNFDFRPKPGSALIDRGVHIEGVNDGFAGDAPDMGAYEFGDKNYWIPGRMLEQASFPIPPDGRETIPDGLGLIWREAYQATSYDIYFGTSGESVDRAGRESREFMGNQENNIFEPVSIEPGTTYFWRVDAVKKDGVTKGETWNFRL